jgi:hypothetical protein
MFILENNQVDAFRTAALKKFEDDMVDHIKAYFPNHYTSMQEANTRATIRFGYSKAGAYGINTTRNVCLYLNNMLLLGSNFDSDAQYPWAQQILTDEHLPDAAARMDAVSDKMLQELDKVTGPGNIFIYRSILHFTREADSIYAKLIADDISKALPNMNTLFRQKYEAVGEANLKQMIRQGIIAVKKYDITHESCVLVYLIFMFMMGGGFDTDPQFPWVAEILNSDKLTDQHKKIETLYNTTINRLKASLARYSH